MPHVTLEYSANLASSAGMQAHCRLVHQTMMASGLFELGALRVRALRCESYAIADEQAGNAFLDVAVRIGGGRSAAEKKKLGESLFAALTEAFTDKLASPHFALSLEIREIDPDLSWKKNSMHARLRGK